MGVGSGNRGDGGRNDVGPREGNDNKCVVKWLDISDIDVMICSILSMTKGPNRVDN